ncbi:MAG TPA: sulfur carrier protein ThiS [Tenuifilaceae bacterium]|nr:sulfur carrier protein ThiS [Tenuifilaceae bacterium]
MEIILNNAAEKIETEKNSLTVSELLDMKKFTFELLIVRINGELVKQANYTTSSFTNGDKVDVIHVFGGG